MYLPQKIAFPISHSALAIGILYMQQGLVVKGLLVPQFFFFSKSLGLFFSNFTKETV
jgi:hypothetical protein